MKFLVLLSAMLMPVVSFARDIGTQIELSTRSNAYICNAGLSHPASQKQAYCHTMGSTQSCNAGEANCVCTGVQGGAFLMDYMSYREASFADGIFQATKAVQSGREAFVTAVKPELSLNTLVSVPDFKLGSELVGAHYFVDVCYRGPQINYTNTDPSQEVKTTFLLNSSLMFSGINPSTNEPVPGQSTYVSNAQPSARTTVHCDLQGLGSQTQAAIDNSTENDIDWTALTAGQNGLSDFTAGLPMTPVVTNQSQSLNTYLGQPNSSTAPRFCVVRYEFHEGDAVSERRFSRHDARIKIYLNVDEPVVE